MDLVNRFNNFDTAIEVENNFSMMLIRSFKRNGAYPKFLRTVKDLETGEEYCEIEFYKPRERNGIKKNQWFYTARQDIKLLEEMLKIWKNL